MRLARVKIVSFVYPPEASIVIQVVRRGQARGEFNTLYQGQRSDKKLLNVIKNILETKLDSKTTLVDIKSLEIPLYDGDIEDKGMPKGVTKLGQLIQNADGVLISSPEYNGSISSPLKNTIDWLSRLQPLPLAKKPVLLTGASPGNFGTIRALTHTRPSLENLKAYVFHTPFALPRADKAFNPDGNFTDPENTKRLTELLSSYVQYAKSLKE